GAKIDRVIVNDLKHGTYFARLVLSVEDELNQKKIIEIDARPSAQAVSDTHQTMSGPVNLHAIAGFEGQFEEGLVTHRRTVAMKS
ncbi:MAG: bifunctional nuclease family protein, partial [Verrucomicrobia bacterium]|nr:bifunctional nuclease family protein [Verrucomicrobiota bacterium]